MPDRRTMGHRPIERFGGPTPFVNPFHVRRTPGPAPPVTRVPKCLPRVWGGEDDNGPATRECGMHGPRFVFLDLRHGEGGVRWMLVSPNNRPLGVGPCGHENYDACRDSVLTM